MPNTIEYYLSRGFDQRPAEYFLGDRRKITAANPNDDYTVTLTFDNGKTRLYDMRPLIKEGTVFEPLANIETFRRTCIDDFHCVCRDIDPELDSSKSWSNKIDLNSTPAI